MDEVIEQVAAAMNSSMSINRNFWIDPKSGNQYFVAVQFPEDPHATLEKLQNVFATGANNAEPIVLSSLVQDIPAVLPGAIEHRLAVPPHQAYDLGHEIWIDKDTLLARLMIDRLKDDACDVNSRHHQAVKRVAPAFRVSATAPDGIIEGIEHPKSRFVVGVQCHPESLWETTAPEYAGLFRAFVEAARTARHNAVH